MTIRKILVAVDFSEPSARALTFAIELAASFQSSLTILHVSQLVVTLASNPSVPVQVYKEGQAGESSLLEQAKQQAQAAGVQADGMLADGTPSQEIVRVAHEGQFDLIVIGTHGRSGFDRFMLGSVAERVLRKATCPVMTVNPVTDAQSAGA